MNDRFHVVVANHKHLECFVDNFGTLLGFDPLFDRILIFDCTPEDSWKDQWCIADRLTQYGLQWGSSLFFIRRRNWAMNLGAMLDYLRCLDERRISWPQYVFFMQDHYLDKVRLVKEDTIPADTNLDLDRVEQEFQAEVRTGCVFLSRLGTRVRMTNPEIRGAKRRYGDAETFLGGRAAGLFIDGGNFATRPELFRAWITTHRQALLAGDGSYGFCIVWEERFGQILYDQRVIWVDLARDARFRTCEDLFALEQQRDTKLSSYWYESRVWHFFYGRDMGKYLPLPMIGMVRFGLRRILPQWLLTNRDAKLHFVNSLQPEGLASAPRIAKP